MKSFTLLLLIFTPGLPQETYYCEDYAVCLERLEAKQRECLKLPVIEKEDFTRSSPQVECLRKEKRRQQRGLGKLQLKRTEMIGDCISSNLSKVTSILEPDQEDKCKAASEKLQILNEVIMNPKTFGKKSLKSKKKRIVIKQSHRVCRRVKKMLSKKCNQLSRCCSISIECDAKADRLSDQISQIRRDLRNPNSLKSECYDE